MTRQMLKDMEKAIMLQEEIASEYMRLKEKRADARTGEVDFTVEDNAQLKLLEHLTHYFS